MIDKNKIAKAARKCLAAFRKANPDGYSSSIIDIESNCLKNFKDGAKWAIKEFIKDLWHPASEKPNIKEGECCVTCLIKFKNGSTELCVYFRNPEGWVCDDMSPKDFKRNFKGWLYIDDLLPKEGGNHD